MVFVLFDIFVWGFIVYVFDVLFDCGGWFWLWDWECMVEILEGYLGV